jgi:hypothetical protein
LDWQIGWITPAWSEVLWAVDLTLEVSMATNIVFLALDELWFRNLVGAVSSAIALFVTRWVYAIFPLRLWFSRRK